MKRFLILVFLLVVTVPLYADKEQFMGHSDQSVAMPNVSVSEYRRAKFDQIWKDFPRFEVRFGYSGFPIADLLSHGLSGMFSPDRVHQGGLEGIYAPYEGPEYMTGNIGAEFSWHIKKWFSLAGGMYFNGFYGSMVDPSTGNKISRKSGLTFSFVPTARFYWANFEKCRLYSSIGAGVMASGYDNLNFVIPAFQLSPIGVTAGKKVFFHAEYSIGTVYLGAQAGIGYRF